MSRHSAPERVPPRLNGRCRDCRAPVRYARTRTRNRLLVVDYTPSPDGRVALDRALYGLPVADVLVGFDLDVALAEGTPLYTVHPQTCPFAAKRRTADGWW